MPRTSTTWVKGQVTNPNGRPKKGETLTDALREYGLKSTLVKGIKVTNKILLATIVWKVVTRGRVTLPGGKKMDLDPKTWFSYVKWLYERVDGLPRQNIDLTSDGETITSDDMKIAMKELREWEKQQK